MICYYKKTLPQTFCFIKTILFFLLLYGAFSMQKWIRRLRHVNSQQIGSRMETSQSKWKIKDSNTFFKFCPQIEFPLFNFSVPFARISTASLLNAIIYHTKFKCGKFINFGKFVKYFVKFVKYFGKFVK